MIHNSSTLHSKPWTLINCTSPLIKTLACCVQGVLTFGLGMGGGGGAGGGGVRELYIINPVANS